MLPGKCFRHQRYKGVPSSSKNDGTNRHSVWILPVRIQNRTLRCRSCVPTVWMCRLTSTTWCPLLAQPICQLLWRCFRHAFPPNISRFRQRNIGEDRVVLDGLHSTKIGTVRCSRSHSKEPGFRIDGIQSSILANVQPSNIVTNTTHCPSGQRWNQHGQIRLSTGTGESCTNVVLFSCRRSETKNQHMLRQPAFIPAQHGSNSQSIALFAKQCIATITTSK